MDYKHPSASIPGRIETERLIVRRYEPQDSAWFHTIALRNREHLARYESDNFVRHIDSPETADLVIQDLVDSWDDASSFFVGVFLRTPGGELAEDDRQFVGQIYIGPVNWELPEIEIGYFVDVGRQGHGYITEAVLAVIGWIFTHLDAHRIRLECDDSNRRSAAVAERCGFTREGHFRENKRNPDGSITGTYVYGLLRREAKGFAGTGTS